MTRRRNLAILTALTLSCAVRGFSIVDELPGAVAGGNSAGTPSGGASAGGKLNSGGMGSAGNASGGQAPQAGSANQGGTLAADAGESAVDPGGSGQGGEPGSVALAACDVDPSGMPPLFCDDFEDPNGLNSGKWLTPPAGVQPETSPGPGGGATRAVRLEFNELSAAVGSFELTGAGSEVTVSFWFRLLLTGANNARLMTFQDQNTPTQPLRLMADIKGIGWLSSLNASVPTAPDVSGTLPMNEWICLSLRLNGAILDLKYAAPGDDVPRTLLVDDQPTPGVDDGNWQNLPPPTRRVGGFPAFGSDPAQPGSILLDDVRIARGKSNVCGF